ncbi:MAG TPA: hybrid sensor histidine kinase/response regulator [Elusimicrobia bacterium]|nr:hybrid sensor histidine kinase/response regulator [Elusimicrobiota bacterium]
MEAMKNDAHSVETETAVSGDETWYRMLFDEARDPILALELPSDGLPIIREANAAALMAHGYSRGELIGKPISFLDAEAGPGPAITERRRLSLAGGGALFEARHRRKDGSVFDVEASLNCARAGGKIFAVDISRDITERKRLEKEMAEQGALLKAQQEASPDGILVVDESGGIRSCNQRFVDMWGIPPEVIAFASDERALQSIIGKLVDPQGFSRKVDYLYRHREERSRDDIHLKDGRTFDRHSSPMFSQEGRYLGRVWYFRDITESRSGEKALLESEGRLLQSQKMEVVDRLAGGIAHDFNNLLTAILGYCGFLLNDIPKNDPRHTDVEEIRSAGERAAGLTRQLLAFSRKQVMQFKVLDLNTVLTDMGKLLRRLIGENIVLTVSCAEDLPLIKADPGQMEQVIMNLAVNSRDAMPNGGRLTVETRGIEFAGEQALSQDVVMPPGCYALLAVNDTGAGMDAEILKHLFEPFFTTKELGKGTGLGLATVYGIIKQSGGFIDVESEPGRGTTFKIFLPVVPDAGIDGEGEGEGEKNRQAGKSRYTILLAEDDTAVRSLTRRILEGAGYTVLEAASAREALECAGKDFDLLLTDIVLSDISGVELAAKLKKDKPLEVLYMSGYAGNADVRDILSQPGNRFLQKPFTPEALLSKIQEALASIPAP